MLTSRKQKIIRFLMKGKDFKGHLGGERIHSRRKEEVNFDHLPWRGGESEKLKRGCIMAKGQVLKGGTGTFPIYFFQGLSFLHLEITLTFTKLCYTFEENLFFSATIFMKKDHSKLS